MLCLQVPLILVGTKLDLRNDTATIEKLKATGQQPISTEMGESLAKKIKAIRYVCFVVFFSRHYRCSAALFVFLYDVSFACLFHALIC